MHAYLQALDKVSPRNLERAFRVKLLADFKPLILII